MANVMTARVGNVLVLLTKGEDGIYSRRFSVHTGHPVPFSDGSTAPKLVIPHAVEFAAVVVDQGLISVILSSDNSLWISRDAGETFNKVTG